MAEITPPAWMEAGSYAAQADRQALMALMQPDPATGAFGPAGGVRPAGLAVAAQSIPDMSVTVASGTAFVPASIAANAGWVCVNNGLRTVSIAASDPTDPRIDLIAARCYDAADDVGPTSSWALEAVQGTASSSPSAPAVPANTVVLASVSVPAGATTVTSAAITDKRTWSVALGGIQPVLSANMPASPYPGRTVHQVDTGQVLTYQGPAAPNPGTWQAIMTGYGPWTAKQASPLFYTNDSTWRAVLSVTWAPAAFTAPPSGKVWVSITIGAGNPTGVVSIGFEVTDPSVGQTGPNYVPFAGHNSFTVQSTLAVRGTSRVLVTGLTPGKSLHATPGYLSTGGSGGSPSDDGNGVLAVEAAW